MPVAEIIRTARPTVRKFYVLMAVIAPALVFLKPALVWEVAGFVVTSMVNVAPIVIPGVLVAAWIVASGAGDRVSTLFQGHLPTAVLAAAIAGAFLPVCGVTVLPLMAGLLAAGVPLAPVMAFWLASPITGPELLAVTAATLGWEFAVGKSIAAIALGLLGGGVTGAFSKRAWVREPLRSNRLVEGLSSECGACGVDTVGYNALIWRDASRRKRFLREVGAVLRLMIVVLTPAFAAEFLLNAWLQPGALTDLLGKDSVFAVPLAVFVGGPAYIDGYAALPLTRALMDHGMAPGAAMAFLVSGGVVSVWGALAIFPVLRLKPFLLYLALAASGSMMAGWGFSLFYV